MFSTLCTLTFKFSLCETNGLCTAENHLKLSSFCRLKEKKRQLSFTDPLLIRVTDHLYLILGVFSCVLLKSMSQQRMSSDCAEENRPERCSMRCFPLLCLSIRRSTREATAEISSMLQRKIRRNVFNCAFSVVRQRLLPTLVNTGIQSAFQGWKNLQQGPQTHDQCSNRACCEAVGLFSTPLSFFFLKLTCHN